jgi:hypothetical protein
MAGMMSREVNIKGMHLLTMGCASENQDASDAGRLQRENRWWWVGAAGEGTWGTA